MALSVSGFPEPSRQQGPTSGIELPSTVDNEQESPGKSTMMSSPRLRGLFGGGNSINSGKKSPGDIKLTSTSSKVYENEVPQPTSSSPSSSALTFSPSFEPLSQQKYELDTPPLSMVDTGRGQASSKRAQPVPRRAKASPVRLGPSLTRLDIGAGAWSRLPMVSKPAPPSVVIQEWTPNDTVSPSSSTRPLPVLPPHKVEQKTSSQTNSVASSSSRVISLQMPNAVAGPSHYPGALLSSAPSSSSSPVVTPPSKVLVTQPIPQRTKKHSLTMRYQPLVATPTSPAGDQGSSASPIRPLPRIPPVLPNALFTTSSPPRQWDMAHSTPLPIGTPVKASRARSHSRLSRRDRSMDSTPATSPAPSRVPSPIGGRPSMSGSRSRSVRHAATIDYFPQSRGSPTIPSVPFSGSMALQIHIADPVTVVKRPQPPSPPIGPVKPRPKHTSPPIARILTAQPSSQPSPTSKPSATTPTPITAATTTTSYSTNTTPPTTAPLLDDIDNDDMYISDAPLHSHPIDFFPDTDSMVDAPATPITPLEVYVDDQDYSTMSRSPSPIRYARPDSRGNLSSSDDDDGGLASSSSSGDDGSISPGPARRRTQLRSYRNSYRPREGVSPPHIPYRRSPSPVSNHRLTVAAVAPEVEKEKLKKKGTRSYFSEYITTSAPATRASSPERKSRSRQPRKLANAVSLALRNTSSSPKRRSNVQAQPLIDQGEVLDIGRMPVESVEAASSISETIPQSSSTRSSAKVGWVKSMARKRSEASNLRTSSPSGPSIAHFGNAGTAPVEMDGAEKPYMWISASKPPAVSASFIPHRRVDSADYVISNSHTGRERDRDIDRESERYINSCGLPIPTGGSSKPHTSDPASAAHGHAPSSSISIPSSSFPGFGLNTRTRKLSKHVSSASVPLQLHYLPTAPQTIEPTLINITRQSPGASGALD